MPAPSLPLGLVLKYGSGQLGAQIFRDAPAALLPLFMTTMLGVPAWMTGFAILGPKLWLLICDPLMGSLSDRWGGRWGRTSFLAVGGISASLGFTALFVFTRYPSPFLAVATIAVIFLVASTAFSAFSVPYLALASELSADSNERTKILTYRMLFTIVGVVLSVGVAQPLIFHFGGSAAGWHVMAGTYGLICLATMLTAAAGMRHVPRVGGTRSVNMTAARQMAAILENRQFLVVTAGMFLMQIAQAIAYSVIGFVYIYAAEDVDLIPAFIITMCAGAAISQPLWLALARRFGKYRCYQVATALFVVVTLTWLYLRPGGPSVSWVPFMKPLPLEHALVLVRAVLLGVANGAIAVMPVAMLTDSITEHRASHRAATEGLFSGVYSAVEKLSFAVGPLIAGVVLSLYGFVSSTGGVVPQSASAVRGILLLYSVIPATLQLLSLWVLSGYDKVATQTVTEALGHN